jgi:hypothetical protein
VSRVLNILINIAKFCKSDNKAIKRSSVILAKVVVTGILVIWIINSLDFESFTNIINTINWPIITWAIIVSFVDMSISALRWKVLMRPFKPHFSYLYLLYLTFVAHCYNMVVPGNIAGDVVRAFKTSMATVFLDRLIGMLGLVVVVLFGIIFSYPMLSELGLMKYIIVVMLILSLLSISIFSRRVTRQFSWIGNMLGPFYEKIKVALLSIQLYRNYYREIIEAFCATLSSHLLIVTTVYLINMAIGSNATYLHCLLFVPVIGLISSIPVTIGGIGLREAGYILLFTQVGVTKEHALGISLIFFLLLVGWAIVGAILSVVPMEKILFLKEVKSEY